MREKLGGHMGSRGFFRRIGSFFRGIRNLFRSIRVLGIATFLRNMGPVAYSRLRIRMSYERYLKAFLDGDVSLPEELAQRWNPHQAALHVALSHEYEPPVFGEKASMDFILLEVLPFVYVPMSEGAETLGEYVAWKYTSRRGIPAKVRLDWLKARVREGVNEAEKAGLPALAAMVANEEPHMPWLELL